MLLLPLPIIPTGFIYIPRPARPEPFEPLPPSGSIPSSESCSCAAPPGSTRSSPSVGGTDVGKRSKCKCKCKSKTPKRRVNPRRGHSPTGEFVCAHGADTALCSHSLLGNDQTRSSTNTSLTFKCSIGVSPGLTSASACAGRPKYTQIWYLCRNIDQCTRV